MFLPWCTLGFDGSALVFGRKIPHWRRIKRPFVNERPGKFEGNETKEMGGRRNEI
jgi:hypothetical protein